MTEVERLAELMAKHGLTRLEYERDGLRVALERGAASPPARSAPAQETAAAEPDGVTYVTSPLVGTVYAAREPGAEPLASVGREIRRGDALCVIEAMKTMNEIPAPRDGTVLEVFFENGALAEFGARLFAIG
ncbi:MAG: hypothetical protein LBT12_01265 [Oscillospiraceae bacterium]|jgi:acetyl-CoA carboxylase biotin carboxyl carrier protein|nr:hypothetical protein [Oscillospiraceae bacterium]